VTFFKGIRTEIELLQGRSGSKRDIFVGAEQTKLLYEAMPLSMLATIINALLLVFLTWEVIDQTILLSWLIVLLVVSFFRSLLTYIYHRNQYGVYQTLWGKYFTIGAVFSGIVWGSASLLIFPENLITHQVFIAFIVGGMCAGAVITLSPLQLPIFSFLLLVLTPLIIRFFQTGTTISTTMGGVLVLYLIILAANALRMHRNIRQNIELRLQSQKQEGKLMSTSKILEMIATGEQAADVYDAIALLYESLHPGMRCSMFNLADKKLMHGGAPSLPKEYRDAINGLENPCTVLCGASTYSGERILVEDIATDPKWGVLRDVALPHSLHCCWTEPIKSSSGEVLGAFSMYYNHPALPTEEELADLESAARLAGIVMEREQSLENLRILSTAVEQAGELVIITDTHGTIEYVNPAFTKISGYNKSEALGKNPSILNSGNQTKAYFKKLWSTITTGKTWQGSLVNRRKDGSTYPALMSISPIFINNKEITHYVGIQQDMTYHNRLEEQLSQAQKMEALGTLVGGIAHDFNNILTGITGNASLAIQEVSYLPKTVNKLKIVEEQGFRAAGMIKQLLTFSRKELHVKEPFGLITFFKKILVLLETSIPENIDFYSEFCAEEMVVNGDSTQLQQVIINLLNNAQDAVADVPEPVIQIKLEEYIADEGFRNRHPNIAGNLFAHICIEDNGCGISDEDLKHIFEPFYTTKEVGLGTGLGLSMCFGSIQRHGGLIEAESALGKGTSFHIFLPLIEEKKIVTPSKKLTKPLAGKGEVILIADDNAVALRTSRELLEMLGYQVLVASDGLMAIDVFAENRDDIALIIMDVVMPRLGGVKAAERIRKIHPGTKVLFVTGYDRNQSLDDQFFLDGNTVLFKPYSAVNLSKEIRNQLDS